jgi:hypothetical protein
MHRLSTRTLAGLLLRLHDAQAVAIFCAPGDADPCWVHHDYSTCSLPFVPALQINRAAFEHAYSLAVPFNTLVDAIARQPAWLFEVLRRYEGGELALDAMRRTIDYLRFCQLATTSSAA